MGQLLRDNWFVVIIAIVIIGFISYFVYDSNKYNVSSSKDGDKDVVMSVDGGSVTADELYKNISKDDGELLYYLYRNAVVDQTVKTTDKLEKKAKTFQSNLEAYAKQQDANNYQTILTQELAQYGFSSYDDLKQYCLLSVKEAKMNETYVDKHFDSLISNLEAKKPRTISIISISVKDANNLSEDEQKKKDDIDASLGKQSFAKTATAFSDDSTASDKGFYGYVDADDAESSNSTLSADVINAALKLDKGQTSDWVSASDSSGNNKLYKVYVNETDVHKLHKSKNSSVTDSLLNAILHNNDGLEGKILKTNAKKLKVKFNDKETKAKIDNYIKNGNNEGDENNEEN